MSKVEQMGDDGRAVTFRFAGSNWRLRLATYFRSLGRPRQLVPILVLALFPATVDRVVSFLVPGSDMFASFLAMGLCGAALLIAVGAIGALLRRSPPSTVIFDERGIREEVGGRIFQHTWQWVIEATEDERQITLHCREPMRSFQLASSTRARLLVIDKSSSDIDRLAALLAAHSRAGDRPGQAAPDIGVPKG